MKVMKCATCDSPMIPGGLATQIYRQGESVITVTGIPAVAICSKCDNAIIEWDVAQQVEDMVQPLLKWSKGHSLPDPVVSIAFPYHELAAA
ncbi:MAG: hypothetical protein QME81_20815 [bacterium]|nr:hypothetical protein [bacterium]